MVVAERQEAAQPQAAAELLPGEPALVVVELGARAPGCPVADWDSRAVEEERLLPEVQLAAAGRHRTARSLRAVRLAAAAG